MTDQEFQALSPMWQKLVLSRIQNDGRKLWEFSQNDLARLKDSVCRVSSLTGKSPDEMRIEEVDSKLREESAALSDFRKRIPRRYRDADLSKDFHSPFVMNLFRGQSGVVIGGNGIGKTRLAWALASAWKNQQPFSEAAIIVKGAELLSEVKAIDGDWYRYIRENYGKNSHLFIDEIDKIKGSEADWMLLTYLIDYRYEWMRQTVVMGNCTKDEAIKLLGQSSYSRLTGDGAEAYHLSGTDRRKTGATGGTQSE